jgi:hypothetical protein
VRLLLICLAQITALVHILFIVWFTFGSLITRTRGWTRGLHLASLGYGVFIESTSFSCPLTSAENWFLVRAGATPYRSYFLEHFIRSPYYGWLPIDQKPAPLVTTATILLCVINLAIYIRRDRRLMSSKACNQT